MTALTATTTSDATIVSFSAATACGFDTACQKDSHPSSVDFHTTAAIGMRTIAVRYVIETPRPSMPARLVVGRAGTPAASVVAVLILALSSRSLRGVSAPA